MIKEQILENCDQLEQGLLYDGNYSSDVNIIGYEGGIFPILNAMDKFANNQVVEFEKWKRSHGVNWNIQNISTPVEELYDNFLLQQQEKIFIGDRAINKREELISALSRHFQEGVLDIGQKEDIIDDILEVFNHNLRVVVSKDVFWTDENVKRFCEYVGLRVGKNDDIRQQITLLMEDFKYTYRAHSFRV